MKRQITTAPRPRLGFLGLGWIGKHRLAAIAQSGRAEVAALADTSPEATAQAWTSAPDARVGCSIEELFARELDGIVIATPSGLHAAQSVAALERGLAVFCQKPLAPTAHEARRVVDAARAADRLLGVDLSYRHLTSAETIRRRVMDGAIGDVYAVELVFHNAYGPDQAWCRDHAMSGGGCVIDLGVHLIDLALWTLNFPAVLSASGRLFARGKRVASRGTGIEDHCDATIDLDGGVTMHMTCSWRAHAGQDAVIRAAFLGTGGTAVLQNVGGSFYDFTAHIQQGATARLIATDAGGWGGRAALDWVDALSSGARFDVRAEKYVAVAAVLDGIYGP